MAFKTFLDLATLPASDLNTYLMKQAVIVCASGTRPGSPVEGMTIYETDTDIYRVYDGSVWKATGHTIPHQAADYDDAISFTTTSSSYTALTGAVTPTITKYNADTKMILEASITGMYTTSQGEVGVAVRINSTDYEIAYKFAATNGRDVWAGFREVSGLAAGTYTGQVMVKRVAGTLTVDSNTRISVRVTEGY